MRSVSSALDGSGFEIRPRSWGQSAQVGRWESGREEVVEGEEGWGDG